MMINNTFTCAAIVADNPRQLTWAMTSAVYCNHTATYAIVDKYNHVIHIYCLEHAEIAKRYTYADCSIVDINDTYLASR